MQLRPASKLKRLFGIGALLMATIASAEQDIRLDGEDYIVPGILSLPATSIDPAPAVLLLHGTASQKNEVGGLFQRLAKALADEGIASLRIDFAGNGDSPVDHRRFNLSGATRDAHLAFRYLANRPEIDADSVVVLGFSQGGLIAQRLVLAEPKLRALATWSSEGRNGVGSFQGLFDAHYEEARRNGFAKVSFQWLSQPLAFDISWFEEMAAQQTLSEMQGFDRPLLAIAGTADDVVPYTQSVNMVAQSTHLMSRAVLLAGANHIFNVLSPATASNAAQTSHQQLLDITIAWLLDLFQGEYPGLS